MEHAYEPAIFSFHQMVGRQSLVLTEGGPMLNCRTVVLFLTAVVAVSPAFAQCVDSELQRDVNQQNRIEQGLQSGQLNTKEASQLDRGEARIERMESNALKDGNLSQEEAAKFQRAQIQQS